MGTCPSIYPSTQTLNNRRLYDITSTVAGLWALRPAMALVKRTAFEATNAGMVACEWNPE
jgi:hypothetical protein